MADPLLTSLCTICHIAPPRYKCPRCGVQTCSVGCVRKHKTWSSCTGARDATAYVPRPQLRTARGVDHDYNLLHGMEVSMQRAEKALVEERGVVTRDELRPPTITDVTWRVGRDGRRRKVVTTRLLREVKGGRTTERLLANRLRKLNVGIIYAPAGMQRQVENKTTLHRRSQCINWQVEWLTVEGGVVSKRTLAKTMDNEPLYRAYHVACQEQQDHTRRQTRGVWYGAQNALDATWFRSVVTVQDPGTGCWLTQDPGRLPDLWPAELDEQLMLKWDFYLARPRQPSGEPVRVTALRADDDLRSVLANTNVLEFPTLYVLGRGVPLPDGFVLGPKDTRSSFAGPKRKDGPPWGTSKDEPANKRRRQQQRREGVSLEGQDEDMEEGEVGDGTQEQQQGDGAYQGAMELGEVLEEHSYGEESDNNEEAAAADTTSSSESDSEEE